jgi:hypothetical protein
MSTNFDPSRFEAHVCPYFTEISTPFFGLRAMSGHGLLERRVVGRSLSTNSSSKGKLLNV